MRTLVAFLLAVLLGALISAGVGVAWNWVQSTPQRVMAAFEHATTAKYEQSLEMFFSVNGIKAHSKLVVAELEQNVSGTLKSEKTFMGLDLGDTALDYDVPVKFFYAVDLSGPVPVTFVVDVSTHTVSAVFPDLILLAAEPDLANTSKRLEVGWARSKAHSGDFLMQEFNRVVLAHAKQQAMSGALLGLVRETARKQLSQFVSNMLIQQDAWGARGFRLADVYFASENKLVKPPAHTVSRYEGSTRLQLRDLWPVR